jgi:hypothetical protein
MFSKHGAADLAVVKVDVICIEELCQAARGAHSDIYTFFEN